MVELPQPLLPRSEMEVQVDERHAATRDLEFGVKETLLAEPPLADEDSGYRRGAGTNPRGRVFEAQVSKRF